MADLLAGVYRHYKGPLYLVLGLAHDANADVLFHADEVEFAKRDWQSGTMHQEAPLGERTVVVYVGLQLDDAKPGARLAVRSYDDFFTFVCWNRECASYGEEGTQAQYCSACTRFKYERFRYVGPMWTGQR